jgi:hypothetical protein
VSIAFGEEPIKFRGAWISQPLSDYVDCSSGKAKSLRPDYRPHGKLCAGQRGSISHDKAHARFLGPVTDQGEIFLFENRMLIQIAIFAENEGDWDKIKYDLTEKLGKPISEVPTVYQNAFGARWEYDHGFWVKDRIVASAGIRVEHAGGAAHPGLFSNHPETSGVEIIIMSAERAKLPSTRPNSLD